MPLPSHRLDLQLVVRGASAGATARAGFADLVARGVLDADGWAGPQSGWLVEGGFARVVADVHEEPRLWANQQGGFQARCSACGTGVVRPLQLAIREGGGPVVCATCGVSQAIDEVDFRPPAAWGLAALVVTDAESATLTAEGRDWADGALGSWVRVWRRP